MADQVSANVGGATLGPMEQGYGIFNASENKRGAQGAAEFACIAGGFVLWIVRWFSFSSFPYLKKRLQESFLFGANCHTGLVTEA
jgi:hypothetical protein